MSGELHQTPPHNLEAEQAVLGGLLKRPELWDELRELVSEDSFYSPVHQHVWGAMAGLRYQDKPIDLVLLKTELDNRGKLGAVGGTMYLVSLGEQIGSVANALEYAREIKSLKDRRDLMAAGQQMIAQACDMQQDPTVSALNVRQVVDTVLDAHLQADEQAPSKFVHAWIERLEKLQEEGGAKIRTHLYKLNQLTSGLHPGEVTVVAARPSVGKTALALNIAEYVLWKNFCGVGVFSLEMNKFGLMDRWAASNRLSGSGMEVRGQAFREGDFTREEWERIHEFGANVSEVPLRVWDRPTLTPTEFYVQCRIWQREIGMELAVIDYLQLVVPDKKNSGSREREVSEIARSVKRTALDLGIHVLLLSQLSREAERSKRPMLSHLRESGAIEQDADNILFIVPEVKGEMAQGAELLECSLDVAKARQNAVGTVTTLYAKEFLQFRNPAEDYVPIKRQHTAE